MTVSGKAIKAKKAELTGPGAFFEVEQQVLDGHSYQAYKHAPKTALEILNNARNHGPQLLNPITLAEETSETLF